MCAISKLSTFLWKNLIKTGNSRTAWPTKMYILKLLKTSCFRMLIFFFQKSIDNFEIEHKTCSVLVEGVDPLNNCTQNVLITQMWRSKLMLLHDDDKPIVGLVVVFVVLLLLPLLLLLLLMMMMMMLLCCCVAVAADATQRLTSKVSAPF